jgi:4-alpha-glucanotransferase
MKITTDKRLAGLLIPAFALRRDDDLGIGDTQAVKEAIDFCAKNEISVLQLLPINETGGDHSPYNTLSSIALDPALLTVTPQTVPGLSESQFRQIATQEMLRQLQAPTINYPRVKKLKRDLLEAGFRSFAQENSKGSSTLKVDFDTFRQKSRGWLDDYVLFRALVDKHDGNACWTQWDEVEQNPATAKNLLSDPKTKAKFNEACQFWSYVQWLAANQWAEVKKYAETSHVSLMGDIPFGISRYSADVWAYRQLFDLDWSGGAPPEGAFQGDAFTSNWGQNWGIPLYNWQAHLQEKYRWWRQRVEEASRFFHYFRIDHVLGLFRIYAFPWLPERNEEFANLSKSEAKTRTGGRLPRFIAQDDYPKELGELNCAHGKELLTMILDAAGNAGVVAEDLGTVPDYVRPLLREMGIGGFTIPVFERLKENRDYKPKETYPPLNLCTYCTHDHPPMALFYENLVRWWHGPNGHEGWLEVQRLMKFIGFDANNPPVEYTEELQIALFKALLESPCWLAVFLISDLLGTKQRFNEPGLAGDYNWSQRLDKPINQYETDPRYKSKIMSFKNLVRQTGRSPSNSIKMKSLEEAVLSKEE